MVQPSFSHPREAEAATVASPTLPLDTFLDNQHQSYYEELYRSEAVCLCILRYVSLATMTFSRTNALLTSQPTTACLPADHSPHVMVLQPNQGD